VGGKLSLPIQPDVNPFKVGQSHIHDDRHPSSTSLSSCSAGRSSAPKETSRTLVRHFLLTLCCCRQKVSRTKGISFEKSHADAARDGSKRSACF